MADSSKLFNSNRSPLGASAASAISGSANSANHSDTEAIDEDDDDLVNDHVIWELSFITRFFSSSEFNINLILKMVHKIENNLMI